MASSVRGVRDGSLLFFTDGRWTTSDLSYFMSHIDAAYAVIALANIASLMDRGPQDDIRRQLLEPALIFGSGRFGSHGLRSVTLDGELRAEAQGVIIRRTARTITGDGLGVERIQMASPGQISLRGLGEPLRQFRELIKDLAYRNRQERQRGDIELQLAQHYLSQILKSDQPGNQVSMGAAVLSSGLAEITSGELSGRLRNVMEAMEEADRKDAEEK